MHIDGYVDVAHSMNNSTAGAAFTTVRGGTRFLSSRTVHTKMPNSNDIGHISGNGWASLKAGDIFGLALAADRSGDLSIKSSSLTFTAY